MDFTDSSNGSEPFVKGLVACLIPCNMLNGEKLATGLAKRLLLDLALSS